MENENQNSTPRFLVFLVLSFLIFLGWQALYEKFYPTPKKQPTPASQVSPTTNASPAASSSAVAPATLQAATPATTQPNAPAVTQAELQQIKVNTDFWRATLSNQGAVITEWTMTNNTDGKTIDADKGGVKLISAQLSQDKGAFFRLQIPGDQSLEKELNEARYVVEPALSGDLTIKAGETKEIGFAYQGNNGVSARKRLIFRGTGANKASGYDFDFVAEVTRNGQPVDAFVMIGPNFGDQGAPNTTSSYVGGYRHPPQLTYAQGDDVYREPPANFKEEHAKKDYAPVGWASVDDNYFAMIFTPAQAVPANGQNQRVKDASGNERNYISMAVKLLNGQTNHVYAGPKSIDTLEQMTANFGVKAPNAGLEDIVSYGILDYVSSLVKPIARFMLAGLRAINKFTHNWGWSIVVLTVLLNMFFFPLRWYSSKTMKKAAAMQPRMKELQDQMKDLPKDDPRALDLQRQQLALMKDGNPLLGCLPLLLQMPFFMAVYAILTVSVEVRHAPFFGWLQDLSSPDPYWLLPIIMCVTMIAQTALTPTTADPVQKRVSYIMPVVLTYFFFVSAPAGLVLYWMVGNLVGVAQQFIINKLTGPSTPPPTASPDAPKAGNAGTNKAKKSKLATAN